MGAALTISVKFAVWTSAPLVAVTVMLDDPVGVEKLVVIVRSLVPEPPLIEVGLNTALAPLGNPLVTARLTVPVNPPVGLTVFV